MGACNAEYRIEVFVGTVECKASAVSREVDALVCDYIYSQGMPVLYSFISPDTNGVRSDGSDALGESGEDAVKEGRWICEGVLESEDEACVSAGGSCRGHSVSQQSKCFNVGEHWMANDGSNVSP